MSDQACLLSQSTSLLTAVLAAVLVVFMLTFLVLYKYRWHIRLALYEAFRVNPQRRRRQPEREYEYDVFVSYANEDVDWVRQELIPTLEGRHGLRLCIHQRDFPVGGNIIDNISTCVHASKRVLFVLSPHFARSRWCQFELVFCQNYVMERDDVLVLTLLAPISGRDMTDAISAMFKTTTYLAWGEEDDARKAFWGRLVLAFHDIVPRQVADKDQQKKADEPQKVNLSTADFHHLNVGLFLQQPEPPSFRLLQQCHPACSINLTGNGLSSIDQHAFRGLQNLTDITLDNNNLDFYSVRPVLNVSSLVELRMSKNYNATYIPEKIFLEFSLPHLSGLAIAGINLPVLHMSVFKPLKKLVFLDVGINDIQSIVVDSLPSLTYLILNDNNIGKDFIQTCYNTNESLYPMLRYLSLRNNNIYSLDRRVCLPNLEHLEIAYNKLYFLRTGGFSNLQKLRRLNLSGLRLKEIDPLAFASDSLEFLYMSSSGIDFSSDSISAQMFDQCPKLSFLELDYNNFSNVTDAKVQQLFHRIPLLTRVYLGNSRIKTITSDTFKDIPHVKVLSLYTNAIEDLPDGVFDHLVNLIILRLNDNRLSEIRETTFSVNTRQRLRLLDLSNNPYTCTCSLRWFTSWLMDESEKVCKLSDRLRVRSFLNQNSKQVGKKAVMADVSEGGKYSNKWSDFPKRKSQPISRHFQQVYHHQHHQPLVSTLTETSVSESQGQVFLSPVDTTVYLSDFFLSDQACLLSQSTSLLTAVLAAVLVVFMLTFLVLYKYRWHIRLALYEAVRGNPQRQQQRQPERDYEYDVFVSYANEDVDWVREELIPTLEGRHGLRLCIHQRDFPVGGNIIDNISTCVHASKRVLFVLSPHFARSRWCQFELVFCQNYVMERDDVLVLTLLAPISGRDMTDAISAMFKTTTYLAWGEEDDARKAFWGRLVLAFHDIVPRQVA
ncbi:LOW QUALITY PROTEIN: toll-like receptor Tollo [Pomacea canaliculata]|uniref:LOW QUALITY PROTEIN: toll-like receptor Tollo n=1 Tax=Pomacea canaliculata TaxID=400727 RepID=UPI000D72D65B|nr:LOW QUALITY PROTEIN: toll-like receptor Tollo [Pomacea canaliculata]